MKGLTSIGEIGRDGLDALFAEADEVVAGGGAADARGRLIVPLFFRPSGEARMRLGAGAATLGAAVLDPTAVWPGFPAGVDLHDAVRSVARHANLVVLRHPVEGVARRLSEEGSPVLNAGDGSRGDPFSGLVALDGLRAAVGDLTGRTIAVCGDLRRNPVVHAVMRGLALLGARILLVPAESGEMPEGLMADLALTMGGAPVRFPAHTLRTFLDMVDSVFLAPRGGSQLGLFAALPPTAEEDRRAARREARSVDAMILATPCDEDGRPEPGRPTVLLYEEPFRDGATPGETPPFQVPRGRERAFVAVLLRQLLSGELRGSEVSRTPVYRSREGVRCPNPRCVTARWPDLYAPRLTIARKDPVVLNCLDCGTSARARFVASRAQRRYHHLTSRQVAKIKPENVVFFATEGEAEAGGFVRSRI